jgi:exodeoxyribonuclease V alpha subunit
VPSPSAESGAEPGALETLRGVVERVTFHSPDSGWSVLQVSPSGAPHTRVSVVVHQAKVFAGATMEFRGSWRQHPRYGEQFECRQAIERKPASAAALERYLGSGLIRGVGPRTARKIVSHFGERTLDVFDGEIERLAEVRGIAERKLTTISEAWREHRAIRDVMLFLQEHGISTLFAVRIYGIYGDAAIDVVRRDPYQLARDVYGIGFFSADRIAASLGFDPRGAPRIDAAIRHVLSAAREEGHCFLTADQVETRCLGLLDLAQSGAERDADAARIRAALETLAAREAVRVRVLPRAALGASAGAAIGAAPAERTAGTTAPAAPVAPAERTAGATHEKGAVRTPPPADDEPIRCYYARSLYRDEESVARQVSARIARGEAGEAGETAEAAEVVDTRTPELDASRRDQHSGTGARAGVAARPTARARTSHLDRPRAERWLDAYSERAGIELSASQREAVLGSVAAPFSVLTGGPGCGKTTTTRAVVGLVRAMGRRVLLAAPTGRAAQRMSEVVGLEARTIHRLLEWSPMQNGFSRNAERPLEVDFLVIDESSMLDVSLAAALLDAVPPAAQILFVGDPNQLPSVGPGDVLGDLLRTRSVPRFELREIFRQAEASHIVRFAHAIQRGETPRIPSPLARPELWREPVDCLFLDGEEASREHVRFAARARAVIERTLADRRARDLEVEGRIVGRMEPATDAMESVGAMQGGRIRVRGAEEELAAQAEDAAGTEDAAGEIVAIRSRSSAGVAAELATDTNTDMNVDTNTNTNTNANVNGDVDTSTDTNVNFDTNTDTASKTRAGSAARSGAGSGTGTGTGIGSGTGTRTGSGSETGTEAGAGEAEGAGQEGATSAGVEANEMPERFTIPRRFLRVDLEQLAQRERGLDELREVIGRLHPHSVLHHGLSLTDTVRRLYTKTIPEQLGEDCEIQILTPMNRGSLGADALNRAIQEVATPPQPGRHELRLGDRVLRVGDRVIQRRNDYTLGVFNGDIGRIVAVDAEAVRCRVVFGGGGGAGGCTGAAAGASAAAGVGVRGRAGATAGVGAGGRAGATAGGSAGTRVGAGSRDRTGEGEKSGGRDSAAGGDDAPHVDYTQADLSQLALAYAITVHKSQGSEFDAVILPIAHQHHRMLFRGLVYTALTRARRLAIFVGERSALAVAVRNVESAQRQTALGYLVERGV